MREGCRISCEAIGAGMDSIKEGMSERELAHIIAQEMSRLSPDVTVNHPWILMIHSDGRGPSAYDGIPSSYRFKQGDTVYVDSGFVNRGYPTDMIRCAVIGKPTKDQERYYYASRDANMAAIEYVKPGMLARDLYAYWAETVCKLGFEESLRSQQEADWDFLGHGLGLAAHELPLLNSTSEEPIVAGMIMAIEGNVFDKFPFKETKIALKNEDDVLVTKDGSEWLTSLSNDLWIA
jgi:Xaa-Pro aminopeptidase